MRHREMLTVKNGRIGQMDYLKGISILTIVLMHLIQGYIPGVPSAVRTASSIGGTGVHVFFLCSGVGLYFSYLKHRVSFTEFLKKKFRRLYLPYIFVIFISFLLPWMYAGSGRGTALLSHVLLFKMFVPEYEQSFGVQMWFISTIIQLYLLFIPMCRLKEKVRKNRSFFGIFLGVSVLWWILVYALGVSEVRVWNSFCLQYIWEFALGMCLADLLNRGKEFRAGRVKLFAAAAAGIGLQTAMAMHSGAWKVFNDIPALIGYTALVLLLGGIPFIRRIGEVVSGFSYELFLVHILVLHTVFHFAAADSLKMQIVTGMAGFALSMAAGWLYAGLIRKIKSQKKT